MQSLYGLNQALQIWNVQARHGKSARNQPLVENCRASSEKCIGRLDPNGGRLTEPGAIRLPLRLTADLQPLIRIGRHQG